MSRYYWRILSPLSQDTTDEFSPPFRKGGLGGILWNLPSFEIPPIPPFSKGGIGMLDFASSIFSKGEIGIPA